MALRAAGRPAEPRAPPGPTHAGRPPAACLRRGEEGGREREREDEIEIRCGMSGGGFKDDGAGGF